jgi:flavodoxin
MFEVLYYSKTGNTKKVAEAIAAELKVTAKDVKTAGTIAPDAFVFLGTGCYGGTLPSEIEKFMKKNKFSDHSNGRIMALFTTSGFGSAMERNLIEKQISAQGAIITHNFKCFGRFLTAKKGHPTDEELQKAREFARMVAITMYPQKKEKVKEITSKR